MNFLKLEPLDLPERASAVRAILSAKNAQNIIDS